MKLNQKILNTILEGMNFNIDNSLKNDIKLSKQDSMSKISTNIAKLFKEKYYDSVSQILTILEYIFWNHLALIENNIKLIVPLYNELSNMWTLIEKSIEEHDDNTTRIIALNEKIKKIFGTNNELELIEIHDYQAIYKYLLSQLNLFDCLDLYKKCGVKYTVDNVALKNIVSIIKNNIDKYSTINLNWINTKYITNMGQLFNNVTEFNGDISEWDVSNVEDMYCMFRSAEKFNCDISNWNTSKVKNMAYMFCYAKSFNQPIGKWDVSNVTNMNTMFYGTKKFNLPIGDWNISKVENISWMFAYSDSFNQDISEWNTSKVSNMEGTFYKAIAFNLPLENWETKNVENMSNMFFGAETFNLDISNWNISSLCTNSKDVNDPSLVFKNCPCIEKFKPILFRNK